MKRFLSLFKKSRFAEFNSLLENELNVKLREVKDNSYFEAIRWHSAFKRYITERQYYRPNGKKMLLREAISHEFLYKGGMIVFPADVNSIITKDLFISKVKEFFKNGIDAACSGFKGHEKLSSASNSINEVKAYSAGALFRGKYADGKTGTAYGEKSLSVEIIDIHSDALVIVAQAMAEKFDIKQVMVKDYNNGRIFLVDRN